MLTACETKTPETTTQPKQVTEHQDDSKELERVYAEFKELYQELLIIKDEKEFKQHGFKTTHQYYSWLEKAETLEKDLNSKLLIRKGLLAGDLINLGLAYAASRGQETEVTKTFRQIFDEEINE